MSEIKLYRILVIGASWHGSNCTGLARGFRELGHVVDLLGSDQFFPKTDRSFSSRAFRRLGSRFYERQFNSHILEHLLIIKPDFVVVFKGNFVQTHTLNRIKEGGMWLCNFYPDVSFMCHKAVDPSGFRFYNHIFTTKTFGINDFKEQLDIENTSYLPHGFDRDVHRPVGNTIGNQETDVSFIGTWSPHKQKLLEGLVNRGDTFDLKIWGAQWEKSLAGNLEESIQGYKVMGDYYALAIGNSKINLGLLSEKREGATRGDQITSRTFHIPASGGFLLHERTTEVLNYFEEGKEFACFGSSEELIEKVRYYLANEEERLQIAKAGYQRCLKENSLVNRAQVIIDIYESETNK